MHKLINGYAIITGGSSGIGFELARLFVDSGQSVCLVARDTKKLEDAVNKLKQRQPIANGFVDYLSIDVGNYQDVKEHLGTFIETRGAPGYLFNFAGIAYPGEFNNLSADIFSSTINTNLLGTIYPTLVTYPSMKKKSAGHIINCSSVAGFVGVYGYTAYSASKFAVKGFTDSLRLELKNDHIAVSLVFPPDTQTPQLDYENSLKPAITKEVNGISHTVSPEFVASEIIKGILRKDYLILIGGETKLYYHLSNILGPLTHHLMDFLVARARKKLHIY